ncbi:response regulator [Flavobacteriaceae bacterium TP-CH-4]|uniref:histidine kinase n=2 Tax=Pelagihabitans pacificus TaxID=2696054 RepID=A0A967AV39_9FLAO|nr:response regulator [Pelagihabitans pacificus]
MTYRHQNKLDLALVALENAAKVAEQNDDIKAVIDALHKFSIVYLELDKKSNSEVYWDRANAQLKKMEYPFGNAVQKFIGALYKYGEGNNFQAIAELNEAKQLSNDRNLVNNILLAEGNIYMALEKYDVASKNFNSLIINTDPYEQEYLSTKASLGLAQLHLATNNLEEAALNAENALGLARQHHFFVEVVASNELLSQIYEKMGRFDLAVRNVRNLLGIKDSLFTLDKLKTEAKAAEKIQFDFFTGEIGRLEEKNEELSQEARSSELTAILTSAFLTIISLLAVSLYRNNQIKLKTNDLLQTKNNELQLARDAAVQAMEAKTNFLSTVSHELRTPLYAVTGLTHLLLEENPSENQKEHLKALKFSGDYLLNFINDILHINKIDADKLEPLSIEFNLKKVLKEVIDSLQQSAKENKTQIVLEYDEDIPSHLMSDPLKLSQIFMNLVGNALKFTKNGEVRVIAKLMKKFEEDVTLYFEVADNGIGISKDQQENIFDGFEQGSIQINREYGGTGLGLTIVKSLLGLFGSKIQLESELGKGSSFFFELKLKSKDSLVDDIPFEISENNYEFKGLHLLIVEDNKINQVITKKMLSKKEITSDIANNGTEAVEMAKANIYDAILMDIHMPGISGEEATIEIRKFDKETPIIALTAISLDDSLESFYAAGCDDVVTKPFKPEVFYQKIGENIFDKKRVKNPAS